MQRLLISVALLGFAAYGLLAVEVSAAGFEVKSSFRNGEPIRHVYARPSVGGRNVSLPLQWSGAPKDTKSFAVSIVDTHPVAHSWVHWLVINIPPNTNSIPEGASVQNMPAGAVELKNSFGSVGYGGPQPPKGSGPHTYVVTVYALSTDKLNLKQGASLDDFKKAISGKVIEEASIKGTFE